MREILFKAKRLDNGERVQGYYYQIWEKGYILWGMTNNMPDMVEVNPDTLCQFTGLTDKSGKKIWENDIVKWRFKRVWKEDYYVSQVVWDSFYSAFKISVRGVLAKFWEDIEYEVIGNIFDNPELLEVK